MNYRTVGVSFELSGLVDNEQFTKADLLDSIMHFFEINLVGIGDSTNAQSVIGNPQFLSVYPNPFLNHCVIKFQFSTHPPSEINSKAASIKIFSTCGRLVKSFDHLTADQRGGNDQFNAVIWFGDDDSGRCASPGVYFVRLDTREFNKVEKAVLLR